MAYFGEPGVEQPTIECIHKHNMEEQVLLISFHIELLARCREIDPKIPRGVLFTDLADVSVCQAVAASEAGCFKEKVNRGSVHAVHRAGLLIHCFNPDTEEDIFRAIRCGVDGIGSNKPKLLVNTISQVCSS